MSSSNVIIPPDLSKLIIEREKVWEGYERSQSMVADLNQLSGQIPDCAPAEIQMQFGPDSLPTAEIETILPKVKEQIAASNRLKGEVKGCHDEIEAIKRKEKTTIMVIVIGGGVLLLILIIIVVSVISSVGSSR
jgi:hypothetical protein